MSKDPPIRETEFAISIDQVKGQWPYASAVWGHDPEGKRKLVIGVDQNEGGQLISEGVGMGAVALSPKKARALRDFLNRTIDG